MRIVTKPPGSGADPSDELARLVADSQASAAARARSRERSLRQQATEEATFTGLLLDLAEDGSEVSIRTRAGRSVYGVIAGLGRDFILLRTGAGADTLVVLRALAAVRRRPGQHAPDTAGARPTAGKTSLAAHLSGLAPERPRVAIAVDGEPMMLNGELRAVGVDVATLRLDGEPPVTAYVALASVSLVVLASG